MFTFFSSRPDLVSFYKDSVTTPYHAKGVFSYSGSDLVEIVVLKVDEIHVCVDIPLSVQENTAFVINRVRLKNPKDWLNDDHGRF